MTVCICSLLNAEEIIFRDLTGEKYSGKDADLEAFSLKKIRLGCDRSNERSDIVSWKLETNLEPNKTLESFKVTLDVVNRKGESVFKNSQIWERGVESGSNHISTQACWDYRSSIPGNDAFIAPADIPKYSVVSYWISDIVITDKDAVAKEAKKNAKAVTDQQEEAKKMPLQTTSCNLESIRKCADYSKDVHFGPIKLNDKSDVETYVKKAGYILKKLDFKMDTRYLLYKSQSAVHDSSDFLVIYTDKDNVVKYFSWSEGKNSMPWHADGLKKWFESTKFVFPPDDSGGGFLAIGPNTYLQETVYFKVKSVRAAIGNRPAEAKIGGAASVMVWAKDSSSKEFFESVVECKSKYKSECVNVTKTTKDLKKNSFKKLESRSGVFTFGFKYSEKGSLSRGAVYPDIGNCNRGKQLQYYTDNDYGYVLQTECVPVDTISIN